MSLSYASGDAGWNVAPQVAHETVIMPRQEIIIRPVAGLNWSNLKSVLSHGELLYSMTKRQLKAEYSNMYFGFAWILARPLAMMLVFWMFKQLSAARTGVEIPYPTYLYSGLIFWFFFAESVIEGSSSLERDSGLVRKVYFPRLISVLVPICANLFALAVSAVPLVLLMIYFQLAPGWHILLLPFVLAQTAFLTLGIACLFSVLTLLSRDWNRFLQLALYAGLFVSPVIYLPEMVPAAVRWLYFANPLAGILLAFRATLFADIAFPWIPWMYSVGVSLLVLVAGIVLFSRYERELLDRI